MIDAAALQAFRHLSIEELLIPVLIQLALILLAARAFALLARRFGQPSAVGEIIAGLLLGPSFFQAVAPAAWTAIFRPTIGDVPRELTDPLLNKIFAVLSQIGLVLLLFLIGLEFDFGHLRRYGRAALAVSVSGIVAPFALGVALAILMHGSLEPLPETGVPPALLGFALFLGVAMAITALPILGRMMQELGSTRTRLAAITITAAAADDAAGWILLATVAAVVRAGFEPLRSVLMIAETVGFAVVMIFVVRPIVKRFARRAMQRGGGSIGINDLAVLLATLLGCAVVTGWIGIFAIFGAFLLGAILSDEDEFRAAVNERLRDFVTAFFLPIFFTYTGLRTEIGSLGSLTAAGWALAVFAAAVAGKFLGCTWAARRSGFAPREAACIGVMMNTRALMELVVVNLGYELQVIPPSVYCMLVLMALGTTVMTTPLLVRIAPGTELEAGMRRTGWLRPLAESGQPAAAP